jgi:DNA polymerase III alpha subunit
MDIDLDFPTTFNPPDIFKQAVSASMVQKRELVKHTCGYYLQEMPVDKVSGLAAIPYEDAEDLGYFKFDFLHLSLLDHFSSKEEIRTLMKLDPDWSLLLDEECVVKLFQLGKHYTLLQQVRPTSVIELADCVALIRPGKRQLLSEYLHNKEQTRPKLYRQEGDSKASFKRSHAIAYSLTIVLQLHLIAQGKM